MTTAIRTPGLMAAKKLEEVPKPVPAKATKAKAGTRFLRTERLELSLDCMRCMHPFASRA
jgi:hypothetical protein